MKHALLSAQPQRLALFIVLAVASCLSGGVLVAYTQPNTQVLVLIGISGVLAFPIVLRIGQGRFDPFEPLVIFCVAYAVMFVIRPTADIAGDNFLFKTAIHTIDVSSAYTEMLYIALIGGIAFIVAYHIPLGKHVALKLTRPASDFHIDSVVTFASLFAAFGIVLFLLFVIQTSGLHAITTILRGRENSRIDLYRSSTAYFYYGPYLLIPSSLVLLFVGRHRRNVAITCLGTSLTIILLLQAAPSGNRMMLLPFVGGGIVYIYISKMVRPRMVTLLVFALFGLTFSTVLLQERDVENRQGTSPVRTLITVVTHPYEITRPLLGQGDTSMAPGLALTLDMIPEKFGYAYGRATIGDLIIRTIPRALWPEKPLAPREQVVSQVWPDEYAFGSLNPEFSCLFYFYWDFGILGVILGMIAYGILCRVGYEYCMLHIASMPVRIMYSIGLFFVVIGLRDSLADTVTRAVFGVLPVWIIFRLASRSRVHDASAPRERVLSPRIGG